MCPTLWAHMPNVGTSLGLLHCLSVVRLGRRATKVPEEWAVDQRFTSDIANDIPKRINDGASVAHGGDKEDRVGDQNLLALTVVETRRRSQRRPSPQFMRTLYPIYLQLAKIGSWRWRGYSWPRGRARRLYRQSTPS